MIVCNIKSKRIVHCKPKRRREIQKGGLLPLAALKPAFVAAGKVAALGEISCAAGYGVKRTIGSASRERRRSKIYQRTRKGLNSGAEHRLDVNIVR